MRDGNGTVHSGKKRGGHLYRCEEQVPVQTASGVVDGRCGAWLHRAYVRSGAAGRLVPIGWYCPACHTYTDGEVPLKPQDPAAQEEALSDFLREQSREFDREMWGHRLGLG